MTNIKAMAEAYEAERAKRLFGTVYYPQYQAAFEGCMEKALEHLEQWRPIETASKKEGAKADILCKNGMRFPDSFFIKGRWTNHFAGLPSVSIEALGHEITHWMLLPSTPPTKNEDD